MESVKERKKFSICTHCSQELHLFLKETLITFVYKEMFLLKIVFKSCVVEIHWRVLQFLHS